MQFLWYALAALILALPAQAQTGLAPSVFPGCQYNSTPPSLTDKQVVPWQCDVNGKLITNGTASSIVVGTTTLTGGTNTRVLFDDNGVVGEDAGHTFTKSSGILTLGTGAVTGSFQVSNTASSSSGTLCSAGNFECGIFDWKSSPNVLTIGTTKGGSGLSRSIQFISGNAVVASIDTGGGTIVNGLLSGASNSIGSVSVDYFRGGITLTALAVGSSTLGWSPASDLSVAPDTGIGRNAAGLVEITNGVPETFRDLRVRRAQTVSSTFSTLPTCNATNAGMRAYITDASATPAYLANVTAGGGGVKVVVTCDSAGWRAMG